VAGAHPVALRYTSLSTAEGFFSVLRHNGYYQLLFSALGALTALSLSGENHVTGTPGEGAGERVVAKNFVF
jgi:hypothetical protein